MGRLGVAADCCRFLCRRLEGMRLCAVVVSRHGRLPLLGPTAAQADDLQVDGGAKHVSREVLDLPRCASLLAAYQKILREVRDRVDLEV